MCGGQRTTSQESVLSFHFTETGTLFLLLANSVVSASHLAVERLELEGSGFMNSTLPLPKSIKTGLADC